jgi:hypothetical protein
MPGGGALNGPSAFGGARKDRPSPSPPEREHHSHGPSVLEFTGTALEPEYPESRYHQPRALPPPARPPLPGGPGHPVDPVPGGAAMTDPGWTHPLLLAQLPPPPTAHDVRRAAELALTSSDPAGYIALWRAVERDTRTWQVLAGLGALITRVYQAEGGFTLRVDLSVARFPDALMRVVDYLPGLLDRSRSLGSIPTADHFYLGSLMTWVLMKQGPDIAADIRECLDDPGWPAWDPADIAAQWFTTATDTWS